MSRRTRRSALTAALLGLALTVAGCSDGGNTISDQARDGNQEGYVSGDGTVEALPPEERTLTIELSGQTLEGEPWSSSDALGEVLVINVWGSWCPPCVAEAPDLSAAYDHFEQGGDPVQFIGVNDRDSASAALAFEERYEVPYTSLVDDGGETILQLQGMANPRPSTLILDREGRLAARVAGQVSESTLRGLVEDVLEQ
ncbi:TlpA family protein disulfide reductase [Ornithinimicrobium cryptoxanthini]|uniref:TlpA family protein disulfide reductase n=1 Tax=Ornithinimicrobium cryptoxanthini TaxID=2934161 RepID=UPI002117D9F9|nr:TlpA disulfide reductase family protein [Ornithinimicrobium cryptoxanthini]